MGKNRSETATGCQGKKKPLDSFQGGGREDGLCSILIFLHFLILLDYQHVSSSIP